MPTTTELRELLHERADAASTAPPPVEGAIRGARRVRAQRRLGVVGGALAVVAAVVIPTAVGWPSADQPPPAVQPSTSNGRLASSSGLVWAPALPGLDLAAGTPMRIPYAFDTVVFDGSVQHELGGVVRRLLEIPEGLVALVDVEPTTPDTERDHHLPTRIVLISDGAGGEPKELDRGYIFSVSASSETGGPTRLAWTWTDVSDEAEAKEVRSLDIATGEMIKSPLQTEAFIWGFDGLVPILELDHTDDRSFVRLDTDSGALVPMPDSFSSMIAATRDLQRVVTFDDATQCTSVVNAAQPDAALWERCDLFVQTLSPNGKLALGPQYLDGQINQRADQFGVFDLETGADVVALDLPPGGREFGVPRAPSFEWFVESWEPDGSVLIVVLYVGLPGEDPDSNFAPVLRTLVRCSTTTGACELVPDAVEVVSSRT